MRIANQTIEVVPIDSIQPHPLNPREGDTGAVIESLGEHGFYGVVICQISTRFILAGNHRWKAAKFDGATEIPVCWLDVDDDEAVRILLVDNRTSDLATYDTPALADLLKALAATDRGLSGTGYDGDALDELLRDLDQDIPPPHTDPPTPSTEEGDRLAVKWKVERGGVWTAGSQTIVCGDSTDMTVVRGVLADPVPLVFTSPPYAVGLDYASYDDTLQNLRVLLLALAKDWRDVVTPGGFLITNFADIVSGRAITGASEPCEYPMAVEYWPVFRDADWLLHTRRVWAKPHARVSAPWTANSSRAACDWEHVWTWKRPGDGLNERRDPSYRGVWDTTDSEALGVSKGDHPAGFPAAIPRWAISVYTDAGDVVADPFCGTGTTLIAAEQTGRRGVGFDIDARYVAITLERFAGMGHDPQRIS